MKSIKVRSPIKRILPEDGNQKPQSCFFIVAALAIYEKDGAPKQRTLNVLAETQHINITKKGLADIQQTVMQRLSAENAVQPDQIKDIVIMGISLLGVMSSEVFHGASEAPLDGAIQGTA